VLVVRLLLALTAELEGQLLSVRFSRPTVAAVGLARSRRDLAGAVAAVGAPLA
jgi:hypothetical protein